MNSLSGFVTVCILAVTLFHFVNCECKRGFQLRMRSIALKLGECERHFMMSLADVVESDFSANSSWWPDFTTEESVVFQEIVATKVEVFELRALMDLKRFQTQCESCTSRGKGYPCCLRERVHLLNKLIKSLHNLINDLCKKAASDYKVVPENCAPNARKFDFTGGYAVLLRCEAQCKGTSKKLAICAKLTNDDEENKDDENKDDKNNDDKNKDDESNKTTTQMNISTTRAPSQFDATRQRLDDSKVKLE